MTRAERRERKARAARRAKNNEHLRLRLPDDMKEGLEAQAAKQGKTLGELGREIFAAFLKKQTQTA